ncbi:MAG: hypothetical protein MI746_01360 [Pseudomonadales bacterium]|nr:hypothetical protein [Pseudomonadales bacterium]
MNNQDYLFPGLACIGLAILYPVYWVAEVSIRGLGFDSMSEGIHVLDFIFLATGLLSAYVFFSLRDRLSTENNYFGVDVTLLIYVCSTVVFVVSLFAVGVWYTTYGQGLSGNVAEVTEIVIAVIFFGSLVVFGILEILIGILIMRDSRELPSILTPAAIVCLLMGMANLSIFFSFLTLFLFPVLLIILTYYFMRQPDMVEVV